MADEFLIFNDILEQYLAEVKDTVSVNKKCEHSSTLKDNGIKICAECGEEMAREDLYDGGWSSNSRKNSDKSIFRDVEGLQIEDDVVQLANDIYTKVSQGKISRGKTRRAMIFICVFHAYKILGRPQSCDVLRELFSLDRKISLKGLKQVNLSAPKNSELRTRYITPIEIIEEITGKINCTEEDKKGVLDLYERIKNKSRVLNRSRPQSVAASLIYVYMMDKNKELDMKKFVKTVSLSEITVNKISKEIYKVLSQN